MVPQISIQLYSVREQAAADYVGTIRRIAEMGFANVEPAGYPGTTAAEAAKVFADLGLQAPSCHAALPLGDDRDRVIEEALMMGHRYIITGCPPNFKEHYQSADTVKAMVDAYCEAAANAASHGVQIGYHNHDWDLIEVEGKAGYRYFLDGTPESVLWEADLFWVARAGLDPAEFIRELGPRGKCLHFKDGLVTPDGEITEVETKEGTLAIPAAKPFLPAGTGQVDLVAASEAAEHVAYAVVELDAFEGDMMQAVAESYEYLTRRGIAAGRTA